MRVLLFGASGQVGTALRQQLYGRVELLALDHSQLDLADTGAVTSQILSYKPGLVINAAAYTAVDQAESEPVQAQRINAQAPAVMAEAVAHLGSWLFHYSTDYVFDGQAQRPYTEQDTVAPLSVYGRSKLAGEQAISELGSRYLIFRTSWVYAATGRNFLVTMRRLAGERETLQVVDDQWGSPTTALALADLTVALQQRLDAGLLTAADSGIYQATCAGKTTWCRFARAIFAESGLHHVQVEPVPTSAYPTAAHRPAYSVLDNRRLFQSFGLSMPSWREALKTCLERNDSS